MRRFTLGLALWAAATLTAAESSAPPAIDVPKLESYIRYAEAFAPGVKLTVGQPGKTASPQLWSIPVHITLGEQSMERTYYLTGDGQELIGGTLWYLGESPFTNTLKKLPTTGPSFGPANAKITIVVFSDFQCPYCRQLAQTIRQNVPKIYPNDVRVVFEDFPLQTIHPWAHAMAEAARCVADGDDARFWILHDWIFDHQGEVTKENLKDKLLAYAKEHNLDTGKIGACIDSHATAAAVDRSLEIGKQLQIDQTPVIFVNGRMLGGAQKWDTLDAVIKLDLAREKDLSGIQPGKSQ
jgi:protein-disulfide isomerase